MNKTIEILVGIPCSSKTTYAIACSKLQNKLIISRDTIREFYWGKNYKFSKDREDRVTKYFDYKIQCGLEAPFEVYMILDNTHVKEKYIDEIIKKYSKVANIKIKFFDIPLWKAHYRNVIRCLKTGKWIPIKVMNNMYKNYNKINKQKYAKYMVH